MYKLAAVFSFLAAPVLATGLQIEVAGEGANGVITVDLLEDVAPNHVAHIAALAADGFMAQTGDVQYGKAGADTSRAGMGGSDKPDLKAEFSEVPYDRGIVGMARSSNPDSANSQFFIMFAPGHFLNGKYTVVGKVTDGMDVVDAIKLGLGPNGAVIGAPDVMRRVTVID